MLRPRAMVYVAVLAAVQVASQRPNVAGRQPPPRPGIPGSSMPRRSGPGPDGRGAPDGPGAPGGRGDPNRGGGPPDGRFNGRPGRRDERPDRGEGRSPPNPSSGRDRFNKNGPPLTIEAFDHDWQTMFPGLELPPNLPPRRLFMELDLNRNNYLDPEELQGIEDKAFDAVDSAKRGDLNRDRWSAANGGEMTIEQFKKRSAAKNPEEDARLLFKQLDRDGSGGLNKMEMRKWYKDGFSSRNMDRDIPVSEHLKDLTFHEFEARYVNMLSSETDPHAHHKLFMQLDANGDLIVSKDEMEEFPKAMKRVRNEV